MAKKDNKKAQEEAILKGAVERINEILAETGTALQPFMQRGELFDVPSIRLVIRDENATGQEVKRN